MDRERPRASDSEEKIPEAWIGQEVMLETTEALSSDLRAAAPTYLEDVNERGIVVLVTRHKDQSQFSRYFSPWSAGGLDTCCRGGRAGGAASRGFLSPAVPARLGGTGHHYPWEELRAVLSPSGWPPASLGYNGAVGYRLTAAQGEAGVNLTDPEWRALVYVASQHGFSGPHLRLEEGEEALEVEAADAEGLRSALGEALEARDEEEIRTPDGELAYDTIQIVRHVLLSSEGVRLARTSG